MRCGDYPILRRTRNRKDPPFGKRFGSVFGTGPVWADDRSALDKSSTDLVRYEYDYDRVSNRLNERNKVSTGSNPDVDSLFGFDGLNRLTSFKTGLLNAGGTDISSPEMTQSFTFDETGNFKNFSQTVVDAVTQTRTHNKVNEITNITETVGAAWATPAFDDAGNMTKIPHPSDLTSVFDATWDAWQRLVKLEKTVPTLLQPTSTMGPTAV